MLRPTTAQLMALKDNGSITIAGTHTVGGPGGGPGFVGVGWSIQHGDLRIPHFFGLHGLQILPLFGWLMLRRDGGTRRRQTRIAFVAAASYWSFIGILIWQALAANL
jgi:hypothetical protein